MPRTLRLRREPLAELTPEDLSAVVGAAMTLLSCTVEQLTERLGCGPFQGTR
jgi:hypothetical protein